MSENLLELAHHIAPGLLSKDMRDASIWMALMVWNHSLLTPAMDREIREKLGTGAQFKQTTGISRKQFEKWVRWRLKRFPKDRRFVVDLRIGDSRPDSPLQVASYDLDAPAAEKPPP